MLLIKNRDLINSVDVLKQNKKKKTLNVKYETMRINIYSKQLEPNWNHKHEPLNHVERDAKVIEQKKVNKSKLIHFHLRKAKFSLIENLNEQS